MAMSVQERQLVLTEALTKQLESVLANQQQLSTTTEELRRQNAELRKALEETRSTEKQPPNKRRRRSNVNVPDALRTRFKKVYGILVNRGIVDEFHVDEDVLSPANNAILVKIKEELRREHGAENCPWTDLEMEAQFKTYFKTKKERNSRIVKGLNEDHKTRSKQLRRINAKLERRLTGFGILVPQLEKKSVEKMKEILRKEYMSSEESESEEREENGVTKTKTCYRVKRLPWERKKMRSLKKKMDTAYFESLTKHAQGMVKERKPGPNSTRPSPQGPEWAVRK